MKWNIILGNKRTKNKTQQQNKKKQTCNALQKFEYKAQQEAIISESAQKKRIENTPPQQNKIKH